MQVNTETMFVLSNHGKLDVYENRGDVHDLAALISNHVLHQDMSSDNREGGGFFPYGSCDIVLVAESKTLWRLPHVNGRLTREKGSRLRSSNLGLVAVF